MLKSSSNCFAKNDDAYASLASRLMKSYDDQTHDVNWLNSLAYIDQLHLISHAAQVKEKIQNMAYLVSQFGCQAQGQNVPESSEKKMSKIHLQKRCLAAPGYGLSGIVALGYGPALVGLGRIGSDTVVVGPYGGVHVGNSSNGLGLGGYGLGIGVGPGTVALGYNGGVYASGI